MTNVNASEVVAEWRKAMEGVTPGPWLNVGGILEDDVEGNPRFFIRPKKSDGWQVAQTFGPDGNANGRWLARCSPSDIFALLSLIESLSAEVAEKDDRIKALEEAVDGIYTYCNDTLSGRADGGPDDRAWQREAVVRARGLARPFARPEIEAALRARAAKSGGRGHG